MENINFETNGVPTTITEQFEVVENNGMYIIWGIGHSGR